MRKFFSGCFSVLFVFVFLVALILINLNYSIFNVKNYKTAFEKSDFYNQILDKGVNYLMQGMSTGGASGLGPLTTQDISSVLKKSIPSDWLNTHVNNIFDQTFNYATGKSIAINLIIPISDVKKSLSDNLSSSLKTKIASLPNCTSEQMKQFNSSQNKKEGESSFNFECKPSSMSSDDLEKSLTEGITGKDGFITKLPDQYNLGEIISKGPTFGEIQRFISIYKMIMWISLAISFVLLLIVLLMNMKYIPGMLKWITIPPMIVSIIVLLAGILGYFSLNALFGGFIVSLPNEFKIVIYNLIKSFSGNLFIYFELSAGIIFLISLVGLIISSILTKKYPFSEQPKLNKTNKWRRNDSIK